MQQIVYTRCKPRRELLNAESGKISDGKVVNEEGIAIYNFSSKLLSGKMITDPLLIETVLRKRNASKTLGSNAPGKFVSYEYFYMGNEEQWLGEENTWPYYENELSKEIHPLIKPRSNGQKHRPEEHVKQYLIGNFDNYPCLLFGSQNWTAYPVEENIYYHDNNEPLEFMPELDIIYDTGNMSQKKVQKFIVDGRTECVKKLVAVVISEMSKPIDDRKFIVIKDLPENVEMWIAAVEFAMPVYLAKQISFSTNVVASVNLSADNTFYCDAENKFMKGFIKDIRDAGGKKNYYSMIVGIHPAAQGSDSITFGMNNVTFLLLDGQTRTIENAEGLDISSAYFDAVVRMDEDISDFNALLSELDQVKFGDQSSDLYELFEGYKYLLDSTSDPEKWKYAGIKRFLSVFRKYENTSHKWSQHLAEKVYSVYSKFYEEDEKNDLALLKQIVSMDYANKLESDIEDYLLRKYLLVVKNNDVDRVNKLNKAYSVVYPSMNKAMEKGFKENIPAFVDCATDWNSDQSFFMFCKLYDCFNSDGTTSIGWHKDAANAEFIEILFGKISGDLGKSTEMLIYVSTSPVYLDVVIKGAAADYGTWIKIICSTVADTQLELICDALMEIEGIAMQQYEMFLTELLVANKERKIIFKYLGKAIDKFGVIDDGLSGFVEEYLKRYGNDAEGLRYLVNIMVENDMDSISEERVYSTVEDFMETAKVDEAVRSLAEEFEKWRNRLGRPVGRAYYIVFLNELWSTYDETAMKVLDRYVENEPIIVSSRDDMKMVVELAGNKVFEDEILVKLYRIFKGNDPSVRRILLSIDREKPNGIIRYVRLIEQTNKVWRDKEDIAAIAAIEEDLYMELKGNNIDKLEKSVLKAVGKDNPLAGRYKEYFEKIRERIEKDQEKLKTKEIKKDAKENKKETLEKSAVSSKGNSHKKKRWFSVFSELLEKK